MRILYHHRTLGDGAEGIHIAEMIDAFRSLGHEVLTVGPAVANGKSPQTRSGLGLAAKRFIKGPLYEALEIAYNIYGFAAVYRAAESFKPDLIYDRYITFNYSCIAAGKASGGVPVFLEVNAPLAYERDHEADESLRLRRIAYTVERLTCSNSTRTIVVSSTLRDYLASVGIPSEKILVLPNGVNSDKFHPMKKRGDLLKRLNIRDSDIVIGFVGILRPWHGLDLLLEAFAQVHADFSHTILLLVGDGPVRADVEKMAYSLGISEALRITGRIPHQAVGEHVALFDVAVSPKATFYASPMKIVEYMAQGKATVAPDMENIKDLLGHETTGLLFETGSPGSMASALAAVIADHRLRIRLGEAALAETRKRLNWRANARRILEEYGRIDMA